MSFYSSLVVFRPGPLLLMTVGELREFCETVANAFSLEGTDLRVKIEYDRVNVAPTIAWDADGVIGDHGGAIFRPYNWHLERENLLWPELWPSPLDQLRPLRRASIELGGFSEEMHEELLAVDPENGHSYIMPVELSVSVDPVQPTTLECNLPDEECYGGIELSFSGMGYFTWQPLEDYWAGIRQSESIALTLQTCREAFPATLKSAQIQRLKEHSGELFMNHAEYQPGDWIVSVSESG